MLMKRKILIVALLVIFAAMTALGTLAYFNTETVAHNVVTTGKVDIALDEWTDADRSEVFKPVTGVMPGTTQPKYVEIVNNDGADAWVRARIEITAELGGELLPIPDGLISISGTDAAWVYNDDGYYYYSKPLKAGEKTEWLMTGVDFAGGLDNSFQNVRVNVNVKAQAVQTANNGTSALDAAGWPAQQP